MALECDCCKQNVRKIIIFNDTWNLCQSCYNVIATSSLEAFINLQNIKRSETDTGILLGKKERELIRRELADKKA